MWRGWTRPHCGTGSDVVGSTIESWAVLVPSLSTCIRLQNMNWGLIDANLSIFEWWKIDYTRRFQLKGAVASTNCALINRRSTCWSHYKKWGADPPGSPSSGIRIWARLYIYSDMGPEICFCIPPYVRNGFWVIQQVLTPVVHRLPSYVVEIIFRPSIEQATSDWLACEPIKAYLQNQVRTFFDTLGCRLHPGCL